MECTIRPAREDDADNPRLAAWVVGLLRRWGSSSARRRCLSSRTEDGRMRGSLGEKIRRWRLADVHVWTPAQRRKLFKVRVPQRQPGKRE